MEIRKTLLVAFIISGAASLIYEITWIRPLQFLLGSTTYVLSIIFGAFMAGLALGAFVISKHADIIKNLPRTYALLEIGIGLYGVLLLSIFNFLPKIYNLLYSMHSVFYLFQIVQFLLVFLVLLIPTTLMGATFPIIVKFYTKEKIGKSIGEIYSANTLGAIIGSFSAGFILIPLIGIKASIITAGTLNLIIGAYILIEDREFNKFFLVFFMLLFLMLALIGNYSIQRMHSGGFYRTSPEIETMGDVVYYEEGLYATVTVREFPVRGYALFINGKGQGSYAIKDLRVNHLLSYIPPLIKPSLGDALVVGLGTGTTSGHLAQLANVTTVELEPKILGVIPYFSIFNLDVLKNPSHELIMGDGRNYLLKNKEKYDIIVQEPSDPWQSFSSSLYSKEFMEIVKEDLSEDGLFVKWVPIYTMSVEDFRNFYKTFNEVFPNNVAFANIKSDEPGIPAQFATSEIILVGSKKEIIINEESIITNYDLLPEISRQYLEAINLGSGNEIYHLLLFTNEQMSGYADDAKFITDDKPILEFSSARTVFASKPQDVLEDINKFLEKEENAF